jgi:hypothetical protein
MSHFARPRVVALFKEKKVTDGEILAFIAQAFERDIATDHQRIMSDRLQSVQCRLAELDRLLAAPVALSDREQIVARLKAAHVVVAETLAGLGQSNGLCMARSEPHAAA